MFRAVLAFLGCVLLAGSVLAQGGFISGGGTIDEAALVAEAVDSVKAQLDRVFVVNFHAIAGYSTYAPPDAKNWWGGGDQVVTKVDLTDYSQCRIVVNNQYNAPDPDTRFHLEYTTSFSAGSTPDGTWQNMASNDSCWVRVNATNSIFDSGWLDLDPSAIADNIFIAPVTDSGATTSLAFGQITAHFR